MSEPKFQWGTIPRSIYVGMLWFTIVVSWHYPEYLTYYVLLLFFLGLGLRPLLEVSRLYDIFSRLTASIDEKRWAKIKAQRAKEVRLAERNLKYRSTRRKDPRLPKNW